MPPDPDGNGGAPPPRRGLAGTGPTRPVPNLQPASVQPSNLPTCQPRTGPAKRCRRNAHLLGAGLAAVLSLSLMSCGSVPSQPDAGGAAADDLAGPRANGSTTRPDRAYRGAAFDADRAFKQLEKQVAFGPRVPNLSSHRACRDYLVDTLKPLAGRVELQEFNRRVSGKTLAMSNIIAKWEGQGSKPGKEGVLLCAHWDTRPTADYEATAAKRKTPIAGANDGASGVAVLLEAARLFKANPPPVPVTLVFFDGEDFGPGIEHMFFGSKHFAANLPADVPQRGILLDMVGDKDLRIPQEQYSLTRARDVVAQVYGIAGRLGYRQQFPEEVGQPIEDDHVPLLRRGLQVIDLIDFDYGPGHSWWHTLQDTPDKCSPASLKAVGDVVVEWVYSQGK